MTVTYCDKKAIMAHRRTSLAESKIWQNQIRISAAKIANSVSLQGNTEILELIINTLRCLCSLLELSNTVCQGAKYAPTQETPETPKVPTTNTVEDVPCSPTVLAPETPEASTVTKQNKVNCNVSRVAESPVKNAEINKINNSVNDITNVWLDDEIECTIKRKYKGYIKMASDSPNPIKLNNKFDCLTDAQIIHDNDEKSPKSGAQSQNQENTENRKIKEKWINYTIRSIQGGLNPQKLKEIQKVLKRKLGNKIQNFTTDKGILYVKIRSDAVSQLLDFTYGKHDLEIKEKSKPKSKIGFFSMGITKLPKQTSFDEFKNEILEKNQTVVQVTQKRKNRNQVIIKCNSSVLPETLAGCTNQIEPTTLRLLRCTKCQKHGHTASVCRNKSFCPKCAGTHQLTQCNNKKIKCINCTESHWASNKNCPIYLRYKEKINKINKQILGTGKTEHKHPGLKDNQIQNSAANKIPDLFSVNFRPSIPRYIRSKQNLLYEDYILKPVEIIKRELNVQYSHIHLLCTDKNGKSRCLCVPRFCKTDTNFNNI